MAESTTDEHRPEGYDEDFVEAVDQDLQCLICHLPLKEPIQTRCGHRVFKDCLEEYIRRYKFMINKILLIMDPCGTNEYSFNFAKSRRCSTNISIPFVREFIHFEDECPPSIISCPYALMGCQMKIQRQAAESHLESATRVHLDLVSVNLRETEVKYGYREVKLNNTESKLK
ncbi:unnamed protein product [Pocillopora meandrina]|uniref:Zinc finger C3HC4 RING-type domain-containing protein n=1 Tax=Pocillopora meandrina TaxID=46732 RepID=A0AAU9WWF4_9CNID|nr:unnamed protein product [Pocillopora meandrina]